MNQLSPGLALVPERAFWPSAAYPAAPRPHCHLQLHAIGSDRRAEVEAYIQRRYTQAYGAHIREWQPTLVSLNNHDDITAAAGYRSAQGTLYLERYLSRPIEQYLSARGLPAVRERIVEAGQFASMRPGAGRLLIAEMTRHFVGQEFDWVAMTVTHELLHLFTRMGLELLILGDADPSALLADDIQAWGRYYQHRPVVVAGDLRRATARMEARS